MLKTKDRNTLLLFIWKEGYIKKEKKERDMVRGKMVKGGKRR